MDELVKQCRDCIDCLCGECKYEHLQKPGNFVPCMNALLGEAADAIEELSAIREEQKAQIILMAAEIGDQKPRWISVEERLPEENGRYLVRYKRDIVLDYTEVHDDEVRIMRFFVDDGWRYPFLCQPELRKAEHQTVTHWMELPILPAEDNENG